MKKNFILVSDTHNIAKYSDRVKELLIENGVDKGDFFLHAGDVTAVEPFYAPLVDKAIKEEVEEFNRVKDLFTTSLITAGNHESLLDVKAVKKYDLELDLYDKYKDIFILKPTVIEEQGLRILVTPTSKAYGTIWGFYEEEWEDELDYILNGDLPIDVIVSHAPPYMYGDLTDDNIRTGSRLMNEFIEKFKPKLYVCGHIHEARGEYLHKNGITKIINVSCLDVKYKPNEGPIFIEIEFDK